MSIQKEKYRYRNDSFDRYVAGLLSNITDKQKELIPIELLNKIYRLGPDPNVNGLTDPQKDFILSIALGQKILKVVLDENNGISIDKYQALRDAWKRKKGSGFNNATLAETMSFEGEFILADKDLYEALSYMSLVCHSPVFKIILNARKISKKQTKTSRDFYIWIEHLINMFIHYESNKKRLVTDMALVNMSEWYSLLYFYSGEKKSTGLYKEKFKYSFSTSVQDLKKSVSRLKAAGMLDSRGGPKSMMVWATPKGKELVDKMMKKYILNY